MKRRSNLAILSLILAVLGILFTLTHRLLLLVAALPLGFAAVLAGGLAIWLICQAPTRLRGKGAGIAGASLGLVVIVASLLSLAGMLVQELYRQQPRQQARNLRTQTQEGWILNSMPEEPATNFNSNLPIVILDTTGQYLSRDAPAVVRARFFDLHKNGRASLSTQPDYDGLGTVHLRGSTTSALPKPSYTFHTVDSKTNQTKVSLLGLPAEQDWVLYAPFEDKTLMRDVLAYELSNRMGRYAPRTRYVELFAHDSQSPLSLRDYAGVYVLVEKIKRGEDRVKIAKLGPDDRSEPGITGGYIVKRDHSERSEPCFHTSHGGPYFYVYPKAEAITPEQRSWLSSYFNSFESALYGADFQDPRTGYAAYLDVDSFIDAHWLIEVSRNVDGFRYSSFLTKDRGGKLKPEPPWDWNRSFGNANYYDGWKAQGWYSSKLRPTEICWYGRLSQDPAFTQHARDRWFQLRKDVLDPQRIAARIDELAAQLDEAQQRNFRRWPVLGQPVTCNYYVGDSFQDEVRWLKNWVERRITWMDSQLGAPAGR